ncbi:hypothetical protein IQ235_11990 [Oscillatoriales cyanobacterium LEGE 11467]|uniref:Uncharacterized protein n=1 Tax=Zarconia navalis LEGE 11467 TaxID=1828826 RepID=A0A928Z8D9_9CYAN|nr:hypothetical protein [Zarconia navalis]MBE9041500.1 hypothetical protein [Zarconia navalis LEGE 11467]
MDNNVAQWIGEIQSLQQQLARVKQELATARASAEHWRSLYTTEAQQRRDQVQAAQTQLERLQTQVGQGQNVVKPSQTNLLNAAEQEIEQLPLEGLKPKLIDRTVECEHLRQELAGLRETLKTERENHAKTRTDLTTALGDTVSLISSAKTTNVSPNIPQFLESIPSDESPLEEPAPSLLAGIDVPKQLNSSSDLPRPQLPASGSQESS